eukprot:TRINITY_DN7287_c0_g2_i1.p1 TRINITY_DN7287_c0_g2~~TRINITY_DN7287_c0_g2_i1.p1  ORF type:complete len:243 (-),score=76.77 TRINITY_DN7287_c0_g2_i1:90-818(-)
MSATNNQDVTHGQAANLAAPAEAAPAPAADVLSAHEVEEVFKLYDEDGDDALSPAELLHMVKVMKGSGNVNMGKLMKTWDKNGDGKISKAEFIARVEHVSEIAPFWVPRARWVLEQARAEEEETELGRAAQMLFDAFDTDGNGALEAEEAEVLLGMCKEQMGQGSAGGGTETPGSKTWIRVSRSDFVSMLKKAEEAHKDEVAKKEWTDTIVAAAKSFAAKAPPKPREAAGNQGRGGCGCVVM